jgi:hypothetical protein
MPEINPQAQKFAAYKAKLHGLGVSLSMYLGDYCVNYANGSPNTAFYTSDIEEALRVGLIMAAHVQEKQLPLGPTGRRGSRKAMMYRHNQKIAAKRRREEVKTMILVELFNPGELPSVSRVPQPYLIRLAVVEAYREGSPIPSTVDEAAAFLRHHSPRYWTFYTPDEADKWAESYEGEQGEGIRHAVRYFVADSYQSEPEDLEPLLHEAG